MSGQRYTPEFNDEAVRQVIERSYSVENHDRPDWVISSHRVYRKSSSSNDRYAHQTSPSRAASFGRNVDFANEKYWPRLAS